MRVLQKFGPFTFCKLESPEEVNLFYFEQKSVDGTTGFSFFRGYGIIDYVSSFKSWLRKFPRPVFIIALLDKEIVSWVFIEPWLHDALDGEPVYVLRAIETKPDFQGKKIGYRLVLLGCNEVPGYIITKPVTKNSERFFLNFGFMHPQDFRKCPINLTSNPGHLILPPFKKKLILDNLEKYFG